MGRYFLIYTKQLNPQGDVEFLVREFDSRKDLLIWARDNRIKTWRNRSVIIGPNGQERGCADIHAELERLEKEEGSYAKAVIEE